jgi:small-conductance mechanosensitive channel
MDVNEIYRLTRGVHNFLKIQLHLPNWYIIYHIHVQHWLMLVLGQVLHFVNNCKFWLFQKPQRTNGFHERTNKQLTFCFWGRNYLNFSKN